MQREGELESGVDGGPGRLPEEGHGDGGMATFFHMLQAQQEQQQRWLQAQQEEHHRRQEEQEQATRRAGYTEIGQTLSNGQAIASLPSRG